MTKIKIAAVIVCMLATGAFAGFTYQAANHNGSSEEKITIRNVSDDEAVTDEEVTDEETTDEETTDEESTDEETTDDELTAEETVPAVTTVKKEEKKPETKKKAETKKAATTTTSAAEAAQPETLKKEAAAPVVTTAPTEQAAPETTTTEAVEAPAETAPVITEQVTAESEPVVEEQPAEQPEEKPAEEIVTEAPAEEPAPEETEPAAEEKEEDNGRKIQVTDEEYIWLCNVVGHEYGANWISEYEKAKVVEVVMNRVNDPRFPDTIWGVLTQPYQFSGLEWTLYLGDFSYQVTPSVKAAVDMYLEHPEDFQDGYLGFWGDGSMNHFYSI